MTGVQTCALPIFRESGGTDPLKAAGEVNESGAIFDELREKLTQQIGVPELATFEAQLTTVLGRPSAYWPDFGGGYGRHNGRINAPSGSFLDTGGSPLPARCPEP